MLAAEITGDIPEIIGNEANLYQGNLVSYFRILFYNSSNLNNPYHNFRHTLHVLWLCEKACRYYQKNSYTTSNAQPAYRCAIPRL